MTPPMPKCLHCRRVAFSRGLCRKHYEQAKYLVKINYTTWKAMEEQKLLFPRARKYNSKNNPIARLLHEQEFLYAPPKKNEQSTEENTTV